MWNANSFTLGATVVLFLLWFRYMCSLLLAAQTSVDASESVARANNLNFVDVLRELNRNAVPLPGELAAMSALLDRDFEVVTYLMRNMGKLPLIDLPTEAWMLRIDYRLQRFWFRFSPPVSAQRARRQVRQMACIICHFSDLIGERRVPARA